MKTAYLDCLAGISGNMMLGALIDAGANEEELRRRLSGLEVPDFEMKVSRTMRNGIGATYVEVAASSGHHHRGLNDIRKIIETSDLSEWVRDKSLEAFRILAEAEAKIHECSVDEIHFHEVGAVDAIVDIVGSMIGLKLLGVERVTASAVAVGRGFVECAHGRMPLPAPATIEILRGVPLRDAGIEAEMTTPTGAAILKAVVASYGQFPDMTAKSIGYGAGSREHEIPNLLRIVVGNQSIEHISDEAILLETNIDDMNPEQFGYVMEKLLDEGALDVWFVPIVMKKSRPAIVLSVLTSPQEEIPLTEIILRETTSIGVRRTEFARRILRRDILRVQTEVGVIAVKRAWLNDSDFKLAPEYEDCRKAAKESGRPIREIYEIVRRAAERQVSNQSIKRDPFR